MTAPAAAPASGPVAPPVQRPSAQPLTDRFAFAAVLDALPAAASKAGALDRRGTAACCEGAARGRFGEPTVRPSFAVERRRASGLPALRPQRRLRNGRGFASRGPSVLARPGCGQSVGRRGSGASVAASDKLDRGRTARWRTRLSLHRLRVPERVCKPRADRRGVIRAGRRLRPGPCDPSEPERRKRRRRRLRDGGGRARRGRRSIQRRRGGLGADRPTRTRVSGASGEPDASDGGA